MARKDWMDKLDKLPILTTRQVCEIADCHPSTVKRNLTPAGRRGTKTLVYKTSDVLAWIRGAATEPAESTTRDVAWNAFRDGARAETVADLADAHRRFETWWAARVRP